MTDIAFIDNKTSKIKKLKMATFFKHYGKADYWEENYKE